MSTLAIGASTTVQLDSDGTVEVGSNGGFAIVTVTRNVGSTGGRTVQLGSLPARRVFGPYHGGASVYIENQSAGQLTYDLSEASVDASLNGRAVTGGAGANDPLQAVQSLTANLRASKMDVNDMPTVRVVATQGGDLSQAITDALLILDNYAADGGIIELPPGDYTLSATPLWRKRTWLRGAGKFITRITKANGSAALRRTGGSNYGDDTNGPWVRVSDISFLGDWDTLQTDQSSSHCMQFNNCKTVEVLSCEIRNFAWMGINCNGVDSVTIFDCDLFNLARDAINLTGSRRCIVIGNRVSHCSDDAIAIHQLGTGNSTNVPGWGHVIANNYIEDCLGIKCLGASRTLIHGNNLVRCTNYGIITDTDGTECYSDVTALIVSNNTITDLLDPKLRDPSDSAVVGVAIHIGSRQTTTDGTTGFLYPRNVSRNTTVTGITTGANAVITFTTGGAPAVGSRIAVAAPNMTIDGRVVGVTATTATTITTDFTNSGTYTAGSAWSVMASPEYQQYMGNVANGNRPGGGRAIQVYGNVITKLLPPVAQFSDWGVGLLFTRTGYVNPAVTKLLHGNTFTGIRFKSAIINAEVYGNYIDQTSIGFAVLGTAYVREIFFHHNYLNRFGAFGVSADMAVTSPQRPMALTIADNMFRGDPLIEHADRRANGTWINTTAHAAIRVNEVSGWSFYDNDFQDVGTISVSTNATRGRTGPNTFRYHPSSTATMASPTNDANRGIRSLGALSHEDRVVWTDSDPGSASFTSIIGDSAGGNMMSAALPTSGFFLPGQIVRTRAPGTTAVQAYTVTGGTFSVRQFLYGWLRVTASDSTGANHTLNTDWREIYLSTGVQA